MAVLRPGPVWPWQPLGFPEAQPEAAQLPGCLELMGMTMDGEE